MWTHEDAAHDAMALRAVDARGRGAPRGRCAIRRRRGLAARGGRFYQEVKKRGYILYPGKLTEVDTFRVGCIGHFGEAGIPGAVAAIADTLKAMGVRRVSAEAPA